MRETRIIMGMPITVEVVDAASPELMAWVFQLFEDVDTRFSTYRADSEISRFNRGAMSEADFSTEMKEVWALARATETESQGFFNMLRADGTRDPSGIVKGWAIKKAAERLSAEGCKNFYVDAGGDIQARGHNPEGEEWRIGLRSPFHLSDIIKVVAPRGQGIATSGCYIRGAHIWNPHAPGEELADVVSLTVIGPDVLEADRFATAGFAMGADGIYFIESLPGFEAYQVNACGMATQTTNFQDYVIS
jgi:thiamine biosynthesis lipoprotein